LQAITWQYGTVQLARNDRGDWQITGFKLEPENIFKRLFGGHGDAGNPLEVAQSALFPLIYKHDCCSRNACTQEDERRFADEAAEIFSSLHLQTSEPPIGAVVAYSGPQGHYTVTLAKLHSGDYYVIGVSKSSREAQSVKT